MDGKKLDLMWVTQTRWVSYDPRVGCLLLRSTPNAELLSRIPLAGATLACGKQEGVFMVRSSGREHLFKAASNEQMMIWLRNLQDKRSELIHTTGHTCYENNASGTSSQSTLVQEDILSDSGHQTPPEDNNGLLEGATMDSVQHLSTAETFTQPVLSSQGGEVVLPAEGVRENWISIEDNQPQECNFLAGYLLYLTGEQSTKKSNPLQKLSLRMSKRKLPGKSNMDMCALDRYFKDGGSMTVKIDQETISPVSSEAGPGMFGRLLAGKEAEEPRSSRELQLKNISLQQDLDARQELIKMLQQGIRCSQKEKISNNSPENPVTDLQCQEKLQKQQQQISDLTACLSISEQQKEQLVLEVSAQRKEVVNLKETVSALREMMRAKNSANIQLAKDLDQLKEQLQHHQQGSSCTLPTFMLEIKRELKLSKSKISFLSDEVKAQENLRLESERRENELLNKYNDMLERYERLEQRLLVTLQWLGAADAAWEGPTLEFLAKACPLSCYDAHGFRVPLELEKQASGPSRAELLHELVGNIQNDPDEIEKVQQSKWTALFVSGELSPSMEVKHLVRSGVPPAYRPRLWRWFVNRHVGSERTAAPKEYYNSLLQEMAGQPNPAAHLVEMDLMRTLPGHQKFSSLDSPDICKLRRVLLAFSWRNPDIGYCQGFNRLAAISLLYLDEEEVFWCLLAIVEKIMPKDYYSKNLFASQADQRVLKDLLEDKLPRLHAHLLQQNVDLSLITINWFLVLFVDSLSTDILLRAWDSILFEGCKVIFRFALALFKYKEEEILKLHDSSSIFNYSSCFPRMILDFKKLSHIAFRELNPLRSRTLMQLRATHMAHLKEELREFERLQQNMLSRRESDKTLKAP